MSDNMAKSISQKTFSMPIVRSNLKLNLSPLKIGAANDGAELTSTNNHLKNNFDSLCKYPT